MENYQDKRFFIIMFTGLNKDKKTMKGKMHIFTDGSYVNEAFIQSTIKKEFELTAPFITNVIEMDMEDFADFTASEEDYGEIALDNKKSTPDTTSPDKSTLVEDNLDEFI